MAYDLHLTSQTNSKTQSHLFTKQKLLNNLSGNLFLLSQHETAQAEVPLHGRTTVDSISVLNFMDSLYCREMFRISSIHTAVEFICKT